MERHVGIKPMLAAINRYQEDILTNNNLQRIATPAELIAAFNSTARMMLEERTSNMKRMCWWKYGIAVLYKASILAKQSREVRLARSREPGGDKRPGLAVIN